MSAKSVTSPPSDATPAQVPVGYILRSIRKPVPSEPASVHETSTSVDDTGVATKPVGAAGGEGAVNPPHRHRM